MRPRATRGDAGEAGDSTSRGHEPPCGAVVCAMAARGRTLMSRGRLNLLVASGASRLAGWRTGPLAQQRVQQRDRVVQLGGAVAGDVPQRHVEQRVGRAWVARRGQTRPQLSHHVVTARARAQPGRVRPSSEGRAPPGAACGLRLRGEPGGQRGTGPLLRRELGVPGGTARWRARRKTAAATRDASNCTNSAPRGVGRGA